MATRGAIARDLGDSRFRGIYHHWDAYPAGLGKTLWDAYRYYFELDLELMLRRLIDDHPAGWSTIVDCDLSALLPEVDRATQKPGLMMANIYRTLLREIEASGFQVLHQRIALTPLRKLWIAMRTNCDRSRVGKITLISG